MIGLVLLSNIIMADEEVKRKGKKGGADISIPNDCKPKILVKYAESKGCTVESGGSHYAVYANDKKITIISYSDVSITMCRLVVKAIDAECPGE